MNYEPHFRAVLNSQAVQAAVTRHGLNRTETWPEGLYPYGGTKLHKDAWIIPMPANGIEGINIHFEARKPGELQIDVEVYPYEGSIEEDAARVAELSRPLRLKAYLLTRTRLEMMEDAVCAAELGVDFTRLRDPAAVSTLCAAKFLSGYGMDCAADLDAAFVARVLDHVAPIIDGLVSEARSRCLPRA